MLKAGTNTISILVWYWGNEGRNNVNSGAAGLVFQALSESISLASDSTWKIKVHPAYKSTNPPYPSYLYAGYNIRFDAGDDIENWYRIEYDDRKWENAKTLGRPPCYPWGKLYPRPIPQIKDLGIREYIDVSVALKEKCLVYTAILPYAAHIFPIVKVYSPSSGLVIDIRTDRYEVNGGPGDEKHIYHSHRTEYSTKVGFQEFESIDWLFGEKVIYTLPTEVKLIGLSFHESGYNTDFAGNFTCNDDYLNILYEKSRRTLYICMRDNYMDCPDRERGQWIGDVSQQVPQTFYALGREADNLTKKAIYDFLYWKEGDVLKGNVPGVNRSELPSQSLNAISELGMIMSYYMHSGDMNILYESYEPIKNYLKLWLMNENGMVIPRKGDWYWFDHGVDIDAIVLENAWYFSALKFADKIAKLMNRDEDVSFFNERMNSISMNFDRLFWDNYGYRSGKYYDDRANALAVLSGLAGKDKWGAILRVFQETMNSSPYMESYVLEAMYTMHCGTDAMKRMKLRYTEMVYSSNSTLWEDFSILGTRNHAWSGGPLTVLVKYVTGIAPETPGYGRYHILPQMSGLTSIKTVVSSVKGIIMLDLQNDPDEYRLNLCSPPNTTAIVGIPRDIASCNNKNICRVTANGSMILRSGKFVDNDRGISFLGEDSDYYRFAVDGGSWYFTAT